MLVLPSQLRDTPSSWCGHGIYWGCLGGTKGSPAALKINSFLPVEVAHMSIALQVSMLKMTCHSSIYFRNNDQAYLQRGNGGAAAAAAGMFAAM